MEKMVKITCLGILALFSFFLWGCGREERQRGIDGCFFQAEPLAGTEDWGYNFKSDGSWLYYMGQDSTLFRLPLEEGAQEDPQQVSKAEKVPGGENILDYAVDAEGNLYLYRATITWLPNSIGATLTDGVLVKYQADGSKAFQLSLEGRSASYTYLYTTPGFVAADGHSQVLLLSGDEILAIDEAGELAGTLHIGPNRPAKDSFGREQLLEGGDGRVYYLSADGSRQTVYEVAKSGEAYCLQSMSGKGWEEKTSVMSKFYSSPEGMLYNGTNGVLQQYDPRKGEWHALLRWSDSNLPWDGQEIISISKDKLMASFTSSTVRSITIEKM